PIARLRGHGSSDDGFRCALPTSYVLIPEPSPAFAGEGARALLARRRHRLAVGIDDADFAQVQRAHRLFDLLQVADHHPGQRTRLQRAGGGVDLFRGQLADLRVAQLDPVVRPVVADDAGDGAE